MLTRIVRRVVSHHGSDCSLLPHKLRDSRCVILERVDYPRIKRSTVRIVGDRQEGWKDKGYSEQTYDKPATYGGGFWERVTIPPLEEGFSIVLGKGERIQAHL